MMLLLLFYFKYKPSERNRLIKYLTEKSIETILQNIEIKKRLSFATLKLNIVKNYMSLATNLPMQPNEEMLVKDSEVHIPRSINFYLPSLQEANDNVVDNTCKCIKFNVNKHIDLNF